MADQTRGAAVFLPRSDFDAFLFAEIGEDNNRMPLTVLSALARGDVDPWVEAAHLARLSSAAATERLAPQIEAGLDGTAKRTDLKPLVARLVALLPRGAAAGIVKRAAASTRAHGVASSFQTIALPLALLAVMLGVGWIVASRGSAHRDVPVAPDLQSAGAGR